MSADSAAAPWSGPPTPGRTSSSPTPHAAANPVVDYFCTGPVWPTPTKPGRHAPGLELVRHAAGLGGGPAAAPKPWFAIGGIDPDTLPEVLAAGASRVVVVRAITAAPDPTAAARELRAALA